MAGNAIDELINNLYEMVQDAFSVPLGGDKCVLNRDKVLDVLDEIRANLPSDLKMAREIVQKRNDLIAAAKKEGEVIRSQADEYAKQKISEHEVMVEARKKASEVVGAADARSKELIKAAGDYCDDAMKRAETALGETLEEMKRSHAQFKSVFNERR